MLALLSACQPQDQSNASSPDAVAAPPRPNFLLIVADDLGYSDLGRYGGEISTPNIDQLAARGQTFTQFYAGATCSPSRVMLMTGVDNHLAGLGNMGENLAPNQRGKPGYEGVINQRVVTLPTLLRDAGYHTYMAGKWHLGTGPGSLPHERGFERSFALTQGGAGHFAGKRRILSVYPETTYLENGEKVDALPSDFYSSKDFASKTIEYLRADQEDGQPFFAFLSFTAPHWPLQVPDAWHSLYEGQFDQGYEAIRDQRLKRMIQLGLMPADISQVERVPLAPPWESLDPAAKVRSTRAMEIYAAMVERMDFHIGRVLDQLRADGRLDNTVVLFLSDNGAEGNDRMRLLNNATWVPANFDLRLDNIGRPNSYAMQGAGWGQASSVPFRFFKGYSTEGGLRAPLIVAGPQVLSTGDYVTQVATIRDLAPTLLEYAGVQRPQTHYHGRSVLPMDGQSMAALLGGAAGPLHESDEALGWEMFGHRAIRRGDWKILWADGRNGSDGWQLFNIVQDPRETSDLSADHPAVKAELIEQWQDYVKRNQLILPEGLEGVF